MGEQAGRSVLKRFWWAGLVLLAAFLLWVPPLDRSMDAGLADRAERSLGSGITVEDERNDFAQMGTGDKKEGKPNNPQAYNYSYLDIRSVSMSIDEEYLYSKIRFWGTIPERPPEIGGDRIAGNGVKVNLVDEKGADQVIFLVDYTYLPVLGTPAISTYYFNGPTGIPEPEDKRFSRQDFDSKVSGGPGTDYLLGALPLGKIGIAKGQVLYFAVAAEAESSRYDHAAVDALGGSGKMPAVIRWDTRTNKFGKDDGFYSGAK